MSTEPLTISVTTQMLHAQKDERAPLANDLSLRSEEQQEQQEDDLDQGWTTVTRNKRATPPKHQNPPRPRFKLSSLEEQGRAYQVITALEREHPDLKMEVRPNLTEYILTPKDEDSVVILRRLAEEKGNRMVLLDPNLRRFKVVLERYPLNLPLDAVEADPHVLSCKKLRSGRNKIPTRQVLLMHEGSSPPKLNLGCWGTYTLRPYQSEPVRCYKCQQYNHLQVRCEHSVRCGVCSLSHPTEE